MSWPEPNRCSTTEPGQDVDTIHVVMFAPSMEVLQSHMEDNAELIAEAGGDPDPDASTMSISSD